MCTFQPGNFTGWGSEGVKLIYNATQNSRSASCTTEMEGLKLFAIMCVLTQRQIYLYREKERELELEDFILQGL